MKTLNITLIAVSKQSDKYYDGNITVTSLEDFIKQYECFNENAGDYLREKYYIDYEFNDLYEDGLKEKIIEYIDNN